MNYVASAEDLVMPNEHVQPYELPDTIDVVEGSALRSGTNIITGFVPVGVLLGNFEIPYYNHTTKRGYQRQPQESRINQLASEIRRERVDLPTAVLLNLRTRAAGKAVSNGKLDLKKLFLSSAATKFFVVDGQHRILAFEKAVEDGWLSGRDFMIPFTCMLGADEDEEMAQFYVVNSTAKAVRTDLAYALIKRRAETEEGLMEALQERGKEWQVLGQTIVERMAVESSVWRGRIRLPAMEKPGTIIPSASMVASLKPLLSSPFFGRMNIEQQIRVIEAYWEGIRNVIREAFDDPAEFSVQKGVGVTVLHVLLPEVVELIRDKGLSPTEPESYDRLLSRALTEIQGENATGEVVTGLDFWAVSPRGAVGSYSSSAGRRVLIAKLRTLLPQLDME
jgi:DGQHR domain-containing protein